MLSYLWISVSLSQPKVNYVDIMLSFTNTNKEVVRLYISVSETLFVAVLQTIDDLSEIVPGEFFFEVAGVLDKEKKLTSFSKLLNNDSLDWIA